MDHRRPRRSCDQPPRFELGRASARRGPRAVCCATHSASSAKPGAEVLPCCEAEPVARRERCRRSSGGCRRSAPCRRSRARCRSCPSPAPARSRPRVTERSWPEPMLNVPPAACGSSSASAKARATSRDMDEVAALLAVLEDHRLLAVEQARGEDREHAGIGIGERLARAVDVEQPQAHALDAIGRRHDVGRALLHIFVERVDRGEARPLPLGRGDRGQRAALGVERLPVALPVAQAPALGILDQFAPSASR